MKEVWLDEGSTLGCLWTDDPECNWTLVMHRVLETMENPEGSWAKQRDAYVDFMDALGVLALWGGLGAWLAYRRHAPQNGGSE